MTWFDILFLYVFVGLALGWMRCREVFCIPGAIWIALLMYVVAWPYWVIRRALTGNPGDGLDCG